MKEKIKILYQDYLESEDNKRHDLMFYGMYITGHEGMCIPIDKISKEEWGEIFDGIETVRKYQDNPNLTKLKQ